MLHSCSLRETLEVRNPACHIREKGAQGSARQPNTLGLHLEGRHLYYFLTASLQRHHLQPLAALSLSHEAQLRFPRSCLRFLPLSAVVKRI